MPAEPKHIAPDRPSQTSPAGSLPENFDLGVEGFRYSDLFNKDRLAELDEVFLQTFRRIDPDGAATFDRYRADRGEGWKPEAVSDALITAGRVLDAFLAELFLLDSEAAADAVRAVHREFFGRGSNDAVFEMLQA